MAAWTRRINDPSEEDIAVESVVLHVNPGVWRREPATGVPLLSAFSVLVASDPKITNRVVAPGAANARLSHRAIKMIKIK